MVNRYRHSEDVERNGLAPYFKAFLDWGQVQGHSQDTLRRRRTALRRFILWCDERDLQRPQDITRPILERYQRHLYHIRKSDGQPLSFGSQHALLTPLKAFFKWLARQNHILYNPAAELQLPKKPKRLPKTVLSIEDIDNLLSQPDTSTLQGLRDRAMLELLYSTGLRRAELVALTIYDIDRPRQALWVRQGKGGQERVVPLGSRALTWLQRYTEQARPQLSTDPQDTTLFLNNHGQRYRRGTLSAQVKRYLQQAGIEVIGSCHLLRHACATHMLDNGADIRFIQALLGHQDLNTTQIYTQVSIEKLKAIHQATHPAQADPNAPADDNPSDL